MQPDDRRALESRYDLLPPDAADLLRYGSPQALALARAESLLRSARNEALAALASLRAHRTATRPYAPPSPARRAAAHRRLTDARAEHRKCRRQRDQLRRAG